MKIKIDTYRSKDLLLNQSDNMGRITIDLPIIEAKILYKKLTSDNSDYAVPPTALPKLPSLDDVMNESHGWIQEQDVKEIYDIIKKLGNFA